MISPVTTIAYAGKYIQNGLKCYMPRTHIRWKRKEKIHRLDDIQRGTSLSRTIRHDYGGEKVQGTVPNKRLKKSLVSRLRLKYAEEAQRYNIGAMVYRITMAVGRASVQ
jgi:hypothetical protein